jgi:flagellar protein FlaG
MKAELVKLTVPGIPPEVALRAAAARPAAPVAVGAAVSQALASAQQERSAVEEINRKLAEKASELTIEFDDNLNRVIYRLIDTQTREVVRQIPSEEVLAIARALTADESTGVLLRAQV